MDNLVGQTLNRYTINSLLGEGGMGSVYRAYDTTLQRDVAIKIMHPHYARQPNFQERFLQEARTAARLDHAGIVQIHDYGSANGLIYIVMKLLAGDNLENLLRDQRRRERWLPLGEAVQLIRQMALALDYAHRQGVLHRDIKPGNVMIEPSPTPELPYRPVITDLGLARLAQGGVMTQEGSSMGTPAYMSPEQAQGGNTDNRSDVYSLGILLYELVTGRLPFNPHNLTEALQFHVNTPPPKPFQYRPDLPADLEQVILKAIAKDPGQRFHSANALAEALHSAYPAAAAISTPPNGFGATSSLLTAYQNSLIHQPPPPPRAAPPPPPNFKRADDLSQPRVEVNSGDGSSYVVSLTEARLVGRDPANPIPLDDAKVSRQHARIEFDGQTYWLTDLGSTNGTFLGGRRIPAHAPQVWQPGQPVLIGAATLNLLRPGQAASQNATGAATSGIPQAQATRATEMGSLGNYAPGGTTRFAAGPAILPPHFSSELRPARLKAGEIGQVVIRNLGSQAQRFSLRWLSAGEALVLDPPYMDIDIAAGQEVVVEFRAEPRSGNWIGGGASYAYSAEISTDGADGQMLHGEIRSASAVPGWAVPALITLCLVLVGALVLLSGLVFGGGRSLLGGGGTPANAQTEVARVVEATRTAAAATDESLVGANNATLQAATATGIAQATFGAATAQLAATYQAATAAVQVSTQTAIAETAIAQGGTAQAGVALTAAALQATQQAGQAQTATAVAIATSAAQTAVAVVSATPPTAPTLSTSPIPSDTPPVAPPPADQRSAAYIYRSDEAKAANFQALLQGQGYHVDLIAMDALMATNLSGYQLILVGPETGNFTTQTPAMSGPPWGDEYGDQAAYLVNAGKPVVGLGLGGSLFFEAAGLAIGAGKSVFINTREVLALNPDDPTWRSPAGVNVPNNGVLRLYGEKHDGMAVNMPAALPEVRLIAQVPKPGDKFYPIAIQSNRYLLWGLNGGAEDMTDNGRQTFLNLLWNLVP